MRLLCLINTPAQAYTWKHVMKASLSNGHAVKILARDYGSTPRILDDMGFQFEKFSTAGSGSRRLLGVLRHLQRCHELSRGFEPSMVIGFGLDAALIATRFRKPCIVFIDDEPTHLQNRLTSLLASSVITPATFKTDLGKKHVPVNSYKELAYLHPNYFKPDITIFEELGLKRGEPYVILRINVWDAIHDIGAQGFSVSDQFELVSELQKYARVFISPEGQLHQELEKHRLTIPYTRIHHALHYAQLLVTDTQTMATEAAVLGTPAVRCNSFVGENDMSNFIELEQKYGLIYSFRDSRQAVQKAVELARQPDLKDRWAKKRERLIDEKIDLSRFMVDFIQGYPESAGKYKKDGVRL